jgi:hypothetical protein
MDLALLLDNIVISLTHWDPNIETPPWCLAPALQEGEEFEYMVVFIDDEDDDLLAVVTYFAVNLDDKRDIFPGFLIGHKAEEDKKWTMYETPYGCNTYEKDDIMEYHLIGKIKKEEGKYTITKEGF